ncbi:MAG: MerR family transcriptional regulator [Thermomicrobiales bacterium]|nr:MerR family transcriptional regulator [Thermomicrobiales bacterium]
MAEHPQRRAEYRTEWVPPSADERPVEASPSSAPVRLYMTSDVRAATGLSRTHLDFYIRESLVRPVARTESGYLLFDQQEVSLLREIVDARRNGVALRDIREKIGR